MAGNPDVSAFLRGQPHAVVGASRDRRKYGNKVLRCYLQDRRPVYAVNPSATEVEGQPCHSDLSSLPEKVHGISVITPPAVTRRVLAEAVELGIRYIWLQPGAEDRTAIEQARAAGATVIWGGPCILVELGFRG